MDPLVLFVQLLVSLAGGGAMGAIINIIEQRSRTANDRAQRESERRARRSKVISLLTTQLHNILAVSAHNLTATATDPVPAHVVPLTYPEAPFELAIFSDTGILVTPATESAVIGYLLKAKELNAVVDQLKETHMDFPVGTPKADARLQMCKFITNQTTHEMSNILVVLRDALTAEPT